MKQKKENGLANTRNEKLIRAKFFQYLLPGIMMTAALQIGNIVDTMMVGNLLGPNAMSAVKIGMAVDNIMEIPGYVLGVGGSVAAGICLGKRDRDKANRIFSGTLAISILCGAVFSLLSVFSPVLAGLLTGGGALEGDVRGFVFVTLLCAPVISVALQFMSYLAVDNHPSLASTYVIVSNVLNLGMDYVLLRFTPLGTAGAALSTAFGYGAAMVLFAAYFKSPKRMLAFVFPFANIKDTMKTAVGAGLPTLFYMVFLTVKDLGLNSLILRVVGSDAMAVYTVCANVVLTVELFAGGIVGTVSTIGSVLYGQKDYFALKSLVKQVLLLSFAVVFVLMGCLWLQPAAVVGLFGVHEQGLVAMAVEALRIFVFSLPFYQWNKFCTVYYQSTEKTGLSGFITSLQNGAAVLPLAYAFVFYAKATDRNGILALMLSFVASEAATVLFAACYRKVLYRKRNFLLLEEQELPGREFSVECDISKVAAITKEIIRFGQEQSVPKAKANLIAVAAEEMLVNSIKYGGKRVDTIDVAVRADGGHFILLLMDNGIPFDPTDYDSDCSGYEIHGIEMVKRISQKVQYMRVLDLNYTVVEVQYP